MRDRIIEFLKIENKTSSQFADEIGVQPSGISHIISGRNNPSLDFILRMLKRYPFISTDWLLFGKGNMYKERFAGTLFEEPGITPDQDTARDITASPENDYVQDSVIDDGRSHDSEAEDTESHKIRKIVWFYSDNSFEEFSPVKNR